MESELARQAKQAMIEAVRKLSAEERLNAFLSHCQLMAELHQAGQQLASVLEKKSS